MKWSGPIVDPLYTEDMTRVTLVPRDVIHDTILSRDVNKIFRLSIDQHKTGQLGLMSIHLFFSCSMFESLLLIKVLCWALMTHHTADFICLKITSISWDGLEHYGHHSRS